MTRKNSMNILLILVKQINIRINEIIIFSAPKRIRTSDPKIRNLVLYPTELPGQILIIS